MQSQKFDIMFICNPICHFIMDEIKLIFDKDFFNKSLIKYVNTVYNLSVIVSFSKILGIAGLRTDAIFSNNELIEKIKKKRVPYSLGVVQQELLICVFSDKDYLDETRELIKIVINYVKC